MRKYLFKLSILVLFLFGKVNHSNAQKKSFLVPDAAIIQYAGSIGYFSVGAGYEIFKNKRGNIDFNYGYVPASKGGKLHALTANVNSKFTFINF